MLARIFSFLLESIFFVLIASALVRAWMNWTRVSMRGQPGVFLMAVTDWCIKPLRLVMPKALMQSKVDWASLAAAVLLALGYGIVWFVLFTVLMSGMGLAALDPLVLASVVGFAFKMLIRVALQTTMILVIGFAILSWVQPGSPACSLLGNLTEPLLAPLRRIIPSIGGLDLSAIVLIVILQIGLMVLV